MNWTATMRGHTIKATSEKIAQFRRFYVADGDLSSRMSELLWFDMYVLDQEFGVSPREIMRPIKNLEEGEPHSGIKPATAFRKPPLKGLWHKHYFSAHFLVNNISLALGKTGLIKLINEVFDSNKKIVTQEMIEELAHRVAHETLEKRDSEGKITGEWIIFAKNGGKNYYLCLNTHNAGDQFIYDRIMKYCLRDFPELPTWMV